MTKNDLMNGDIVVLKSGHLAVVIRNEKADYLLWQAGGWEELEFYTEDMVSELEDDDAIMKVYRAAGCAHGFSDFEGEDLIYERDCTWTRPTKEEMEAKAEAARIERDAMFAEMFAERKLDAAKEEEIAIVTQAFYGNRVCAVIDKKNIDRFILGLVDNYIKFDLGENIDRTIVKVPNERNLVLVYNKYQEEKELIRKEKLAREENYNLKPLATIPELNMEIYSRCIACRIDANGELVSIEDGDYDKVIKYLAE